MNQLLLTTIGAPFFMGIAVAVLASISGNKRGPVVALLVPLAALAIHFLLEGLPTFPPIAAKQKLPVILAAGAILFTLMAFVDARLSSARAVAITGVTLAASGWWLGKNVLIANPVKAAVVVAIAVIAAIAIGLCAAPSTNPRRRNPSALPPALLSMAIAAAMAAALGAFVGMAQINGALAAFTGGWLLIAYIRYVLGNDDALALTGHEGIAFGFVIAIHAIMTALFAPKAAPAALILATLPLAVAAFTDAKGISFERLPRPVRPLATGLVTATPALLAIAIAVALFEG